MNPRWGIAVVIAALIWAAVILAISMTLEGLTQSGRVLQILGGGAAATIILLGGLGRQTAKG